jgi:hypothetical protein
VFNALRRLVQRYGFFKRDYLPCPANPDWASADFFTEHRRKNERLAAIASEIAALNVKRLTAKEQKKNQTIFVLRMNELMRERLTIEVRGFHDAKQAELKSSLIK